jgi:threonyl-tRNA synthetase
LPVNNAIHAEYATKVKQALEANDIRVEIDNSEEKLGYRLRLAQMNKIPYSIVIGDSEMEKTMATYRLYGQTEQVSVQLSQLIEKIVNDIKTQSLTR